MAIILPNTPDDNQCVTVSYVKTKSKYSDPNDTTPDAMLCSATRANTYGQKDVTPSGRICVGSQIKTLTVVGPIVPDKPIDDNTVIKLTFNNSKLDSIHIIAGTGTPTKSYFNYEMCESSTDLSVSTFRYKKDGSTQLNNASGTLTTIKPGDSVGVWSYSNGAWTKRLSITLPSNNTSYNI